jgi:hypothetical protein
MTDDGTIDAVPRRSSGHIDSVRAGVIVIAFLAALGLLLGPASNLVAVAPNSTTTHHTTPPKPVVKSKVRVQIANGTSVSGLAHSWSDPLALIGWDMLPPVDATTHPARTIIYFAVGEQRAGDVLANDLHVSHKYVTPIKARIGVAGALNDDLVVVIGRNHHGEGLRTGL